MVTYGALWTLEWWPLCCRTAKVWIAHKTPPNARWFPHRQNHFTYFTKTRLLATEAAGKRFFHGQALSRAEVSFVECVTNCRDESGCQFRSFFNTVEPRLETTSVVRHTLHQKHFSSVPNDLRICKTPSPLRSLSQVLQVILTLSSLLPSVSGQSNSAFKRGRRPIFSNFAEHLLFWHKWDWDRSISDTGPLNTGF